MSEAWRVAERLGLRGSRPWVVAHRGEALRAPENTIAALELAVQAGADAVELDVQVSRDGVPVVIHDQRLDRTTTGSGPVRERYWSELRELDAGSWFAPRYGGERIPALEEVLAWAADRGTSLLVELKTHPALDPDAVGAVTSVLRDLKGERFLVFSADHELICELRNELPEVAVGVMLNERILSLNDYLRGTHTSLLSQSPDVLMPGLVGAAHDLGCLVSTGVRQLDDVPLLVSWEVDLLVSDQVEVTSLRAEVALCRESASR